MAAADQIMRPPFLTAVRLGHRPFLTSRPVSFKHQSNGCKQPKRIGLKTEALFGGGGSAKAAGPAYICKDCGYIYDGRQSFESLEKDYRCPVCNAPKRRFTLYKQPVPRGANNLTTRKERKAELQSTGGGGLNPGIVLAVGAAVVLGAFLYLNSVY